MKDRDFPRDLCIPVPAKDNRGGKRIVSRGRSLVEGAQRKSVRVFSADSQKRLSLVRQFICLQ